MRFRFRDYILVIAAVVIVALVVYKQTRTYNRPASLAERALTAPAPIFEAYDSDNRLVKLNAFLGRHEIVLVFFDGKAGAGADSRLLLVRDKFDKLKSAGIEVLAVSTALPQDNRRVMQEIGKFPFPLLSDPALNVHQQWGRVDKSTGQTKPAVFLIDRAGNVRWSDGAPEPLQEPENRLRAMIGGN